MSERAIRIRPRNLAIRDPSRRGISSYRIRDLDLDFFVAMIKSYLIFMCLNFFVHSVSVVVSAFDRYFQLADNNVLI